MLLAFIVSNRRFLSRLCHRELTEYGRFIRAEHRKLLRLFRRSGQRRRFLGMGENELLFQLRDQIIKGGVDRLAFLALRISLDDFNDAVFVNVHSDAAFGVADKIIRLITQLILDLASERPRRHFNLAVPIAAVLLGGIAHSL